MRVISKIAILIIFVSTSAFAQKTEQNDSNNTTKCSPLYVGFSTGLNNQNGILGLNFEIPIATQFSLGTGLGIGTWGIKTYGEIVIYFNNRCQRSGAFVVGATYAFGPKGLVVNASTSAGGRDVSVSGTGATNMSVSYRQYFITGKQGHKFYFQLGYSARLIKPIYYVTSVNGAYYANLSPQGYKFIGSLAPGGIMASIGFLFGTKN
jgi:hypothetical protein